MQGDVVGFVCHETLGFILEVNHELWLVPTDLDLIRLETAMDKVLDGDVIFPFDADYSLLVGADTYFVTWQLQGLGGLTDVFEPLVFPVAHYSEFLDSLSGC